MHEYDLSQERKHGGWEDEQLEWSVYHFEPGHGTRLGFLHGWRAYYEEEESLRAMVKELVKAEINRIRGDLDGFRRLRRQLEAGKAIILPTEPIHVPEFPEAEIAETKARILSETPSETPFDPLEFAEKNDLDFLLVLRSVKELVKQGRLQEAVESRRG